MILSLRDLRAVGVAAVSVALGALVLTGIAGCSGSEPASAGDPGELQIREERPVSSRAFETEAVETETEDREEPDAEDTEGEGLRAPTDLEERDGDDDGSP